MKRLLSIKHLFLGALIAGLWALPIRAASTDDLDIHVSLNGSKSLSINATSYDFGSMDVNSSSVSTTSIIVTNDSGVFIETFTVQATNAISDTGGTDWVLASSTGTNQYALGAQFSTSRPADDNATWSGDDVSTSAQVCSDTIFGNGDIAQSGTDVMPGSSRNLWFRLKTPSSVSDAGPHTISVTISVY